jgi:hypothetical protein
MINLDAAQEVLLRILELFSECAIEISTNPLQVFDWTQGEERTWVEAFWPHWLLGRKQAWHWLRHVFGLECSE